MVYITTSFREIFFHYKTIFFWFQGQTKLEEHYRFSPHGKEPVYSIFFLDNIREPAPEQGCWGFLVTAGPVRYFFELISIRLVEGY